MKTTSDDTIPVMNARRSLSKFFQGTVDREMLFIKLSTNGLILKNSSLPSVVGIAAAKYSLIPGRRIRFIDRYERFYFPREAYNAARTRPYALATISILPWLHDPENRTFDLMEENVDILRLEQERIC